MLTSIIVKMGKYWFTSSFAWFTEIHMGYNKLSEVWLAKTSFKCSIIVLLPAGNVTYFLLLISSRIIKNIFFFVIKTHFCHDLSAVYKIKMVISKDSLIYTFLIVFIIILQVMLFITELVSIFVNLFHIQQNTRSKILHDIEYI